MKRVINPTTLFFFIIAMVIAFVASADVSFTLTPNATTAAVGDHIYLSYAVAANDTAFNAYDAWIQFDPAKVQFLGISEGSYMVDACGTTFFWWRDQTTAIQLAHSLWCQGIVLRGTGEVTVLEFQALTAGTASFIPSPIETYRAGYNVPCSAAGCIVEIGGGVPCALSGRLP